MKKRIFIVFSIVAVLCCACIFAACDNTSNEISQRNAQLKRVALATVGAENYDTEYSNITNDEEGNFVVEVVINGIKYDVTISRDHNVVAVDINDRRIDKDLIPEVPFGDSDSYIGKDTAGNIALDDASTTRDAVTKFKVKFDFDDGVYLYEVEFELEGVEYEYDILATTGEIHKKEVDDVTVFEKAPDGKEFIGADVARQIALEHAQVNEQNVVELKKSKLDFDKGTYVYEVEFKTLTAEYEYEINAETGAVIKFEVDGKFEDVPSGEFIGLNAAKEIAMAHAGVDPSNVLFRDSELDFDDGKYIYELKFTVGIYEYKYEIDANTGAIVKQKMSINSK